MDENDLGQSLGKKQQHATENENETESLVISFQSLAAEGDILAKQGDFRKAIEAFSKALAVRPTDKHVLVARSKCFLQMGDSQSALDDANTALKHDPEFFKGVLFKAEALYAKGDFEMALVFYHRGNKLRPELDEFRLGIQKAREAIDNSIGNPKDYKFQPPSSVRPATAVPVVGTHIVAGVTLPSSAVAPGARPSTMAPSVAKDSQKRDVSALAHNSEKVLLGELYSDKMYLESLMSDKDFINNPNNEICTLVTDALQYLETRTEFWRQQKPLYARRKEHSKILAKAINDRNREAISAKAKRFSELKLVDPESRQKVLKKRPGSGTVETVKAIKAAMNVINGAIDRGDLQAALASSRTLLSRLNDIIGLENRERAISDVLSTMGNIFLELDNIPQAMQHHRKDLTLSRSHRLVDCISRALGNIGRTCVKMKRYEDAITSFEKKLVLVSPGTLERAWLLHDIGRCHLELGREEIAVLKGRESLAISESLKDKRWCINAHVLIAQGEALSSKMGPALTEYNVALNLATELHDTKAVEAITHALDLLSIEMDNKSSTNVPKQPQPPSQQQPKRAVSARRERPKRAQSVGAAKAGPLQNKSKGASGASSAGAPPVLVKEGSVVGASAGGGKSVAEAVAV
ncbi:Tetratricopeptide repeat protein 25 [Phlyctochytrium planicorne]|nr:Tetratricopeptide repeat protein 25 [Phlyctochytrium planicorne]